MKDKKNKVNNKKMNDKDSNEINNNKSFFQIQSSAFQVMKRFHPLDRSLIPLFLLSAIIKGILPYIPVFFSKPILNALIYRNYRIATINIVILSVSLFFCHLIENLLDYQLRIHGENVSKKVKTILYEHPLDLDYESLENGNLMDHFMEALLSMQYKTNYYDLLNQYAILGANIVSILISISLVLKLCFSVGHSNISWLNNLTAPWVSVLLLLVTLTIVNGVLTRIVSWTKKKVFKLFQEKIKSEKAAMTLYGMMSDDELIKAVQTFNGFKMIFSVFDEAITNIKVHYIKELRYMIMEVISKASLGSVITIFSYLLVGVKVLAKAITLGSFVQYTQAITKMNDAISQVVSSKVSISESVMYFEELLKFLDIRNKFETGSIPIEKRNDHEYELAFEQVWYRYPGQKEYVLKDINLRLNLHGKNALVGTNGAGKTTLIKLLCRLYEPTKGRITLNGVDIKKYNYQEYLSLFSVVFQDFGLTNYSLAENVACSMKYDKVKILDCLHKAGLTTFDVQLEDSISTEEGTRDSMVAKEGLGYSGGQQQKIAIARALYKDAPVVILDEPTAALDPLSEFDIYQRFNDLIQDRMCVYISHRMSSCRFCTDIIVLNNGMVEERGSHEELLKNNMLYAKMWLAQAKYYQG